ncbi:MAG: hypothetical protein A2Y41_09550 [Spirochaetes bacterium GWB1_36_13]|nr:MAG: hypothetical protein A2Y41_09550 [Spirochaetes bacterium GWB1_36_13]
MTIERLVLGSLGANCYLVGDEKKVSVIDPGDEAEVIEKNIRNRELQYIFLTHTHIDHIGALKALKKKYPDAKIAVHEKEAGYLSNPAYNLSSFIGIDYIYPGQPEILMQDGSTYPFLDNEFKVFHTPGHTPGGCCFLFKDNLFSGDTLFKTSIGRTDFPGGSYQTLLDSIKNKLFTLSDSVKVFPGHMEETTIGFEKKHNPFLV